MNQRKRAWLYSRVDTGDLSLIEDQKKELAEYAKQMGYEVVGESHDIGSGLNYNRDGITEVSAAAASGRMDTVFIKTLSCLGRDTYQTLKYIEQLNQRGVEVFSLTEGAVKTIVQNEMISDFVNKMQL